ncbi:MAG TPA: AbrB/MazE/SpoVT family DNA-binding domain-containing protein [Bryobacteraceae bacterium]|nr:AbrB/MazE/SpoVT family DNA-binding domain-containing protein [Bryobacteraceae bacterium]
MGKVTSKYQVTLPKAIAEQYDIHPGDELDWVPAGEVIRIIPPGQKPAPEDPNSSLRLFDQATQRQRRRPSARPKQPPRNRGWKREDLYVRGRSH